MVRRTLASDVTLLSVEGKHKLMELILEMSQKHYMVFVYF